MSLRSKSALQDSPRPESVDESTVRDLVTRGAAELGVTLSGGDIDCVVLHYREVMRWRRRADLTALTDARSVAIRHYLDSLTLAPLLPRGATLADLGTGAGFPGVPVAIARPDLSVVLLETREVKLAFLHHVSGLLERPNIRVARTSDLVRDSAAPRSDIVVARAVAHLTEALGRCLALVDAGGQVWLMRGPSRSGEEPGQALETWEFLDEHQVALPFDGSRRRILMYRRRGR